MTKQFFKSFDIVFDVEKKEEQLSLFKKLVNSFCTKKKRPTTVAMENIRKMYRSVKDKTNYSNCIRIQDSNFDHILLGYEAARRTKTNKYLLMRDFEQLVELLSSFVEEPKEREYEIEITVEVPRPKKLRKVTTYDKITILERWVKIGYKMYRRQFDSWTGNEYIVVDGDVYKIKYDRYGREYLA